MVESKIRFLFHANVGKDYQWTQITHASSLNHYEKALLGAITQDLGSSRRTQTRVYSTADLLSEESLRWYGIKAYLYDRKRELGFEVECSNPYWTIQPGGIFSTQYKLCNTTIHGFCTGRGNLSSILGFSFNFCLVFYTSSFPFSFIVSDTWRFSSIGPTMFTIAWEAREEGRNVC